jgi:hypothetical protein
MTIHKLSPARTQLKNRQKLLLDRRCPDCGGILKYDSLTRTHVSSCGFSISKELFDEIIKKEY